VKNERAAVPLRNPKDAAFVILAESRYSTGGLALSRELSQRGVGAQTIALDPTMPDANLDAAAQKAAASAEIVVLAFASAGVYQNGLSLPGNFPKLIETLIASGRPVTLVSLGSPYLVRGFPKVGAYLTTYSSVAPSEIAAVKALFGEIEIGGHLPVTIPGIADLGFGIVLPRRGF
jgi:beta-N-acetylhexosaminidase